VGLGNPGADYQDTYHNVGFRVVEVLARRWGGTLRSQFGGARVGQISAAPRRVLVQPLTFMNLSGSVLAPLMGQFGEDARLLVISDDVALPAGRIRIRERGSAGGHNGLKSIGSVLGSDEYLRVRVGIQPPLPEGVALPAGVPAMRDFVLSRVRRTDRDLLDRCEALAAEAVECILEHGALEAMSRYNGMDLRQVAE
jgi:PTH1 family peptidyl-tRNA hydrolase